MSTVRVLDIDVNSYKRHAFHDADMPWQETNCYFDIWIELIHAFGFEVQPCLGFTLGADFEQEQWTFFKPSFENLRKLYGFQTEELAIWRSLPEQCAIQISNGSLPLLEVDAYYLPDTKASDYRANHVKTTIGINEIDPAGCQLGYFHNAGYHYLSDRDYRGVFRLDRTTPEDYLPPYCEIVKTQSLAKSPPTIDLALKLLREHYDCRPTSNPFERYAADFETHLAWITGMDAYHAYVFATLRQCGAAFYLASRHLSWLSHSSSAAAEPLRGGAGEFATVSSLCKTLLLKLARVANGKSPRGIEPLLDEMATAWKRGISYTGDALAAAR